MEQPIARSLPGTVSEDNGKGLEESETPWDLCESLIHAMLSKFYVVKFPAIHLICSSRLLFLLRNLGVRNIYIEID